MDEAKTEKMKMKKTEVERTVIEKVRKAETTVTGMKEVTGKGEQVQICLFQLNIHYEKMENSILGQHLGLTWGGGLGIHFHNK